MIGAGVIGLELGSVWRRLGSKVTVVEFLDGVLPGMDGEVRKQAQRIFEKQGITFKLSSKVTGVDASGKTLKAKVEPAKGGAAETIEADVVLVAVGRTPYTEGPWARGSRREEGRARPRRGRQAFRHQCERHLCHRRRDRRADAGAQGGGRGRRGGGNSRRPGRACELRRDPERGLHLSGDRLGRKIRGGIESRRASLTTPASFPSPPMAAPRPISPPKAL